MFRSLLPLLLLPALAFAQAEEKLEIRGLGSCGLTTRYASSQIGDNCLQEAENVYLDEDAGISRRKGFAKFNETAIQDANSVRGVWPFRATDGTEYIVVLSSQTMFQSDGDGSFSEITPSLSTKNRTQDMDCAQCLGKQWCVNGSDAMFFWDATSTGSVSGAPTCSAIDCFRNRVVLSNCSGTLSQLRMSGELDGTDWTIPSSPVSTSPVALSIGGVNDGKKVQCIQGVYQDVLVVGKEDSTHGLYGFDRRDFSVREISREVGCIENKSGREKQGSLYWLSKRGVEKMTGPSITRVSDPIRDLVDTIIVAGGNSRSVTDTTQADFEAGNLTASGAGAPMSATISPGSVVPSTFTRTDDLYTDFISGTATDTSLSASSNSVVLQTENLTLDAFTDGDCSSSPAWSICGSSGWSVSSSRMQHSLINDTSETSTANTGPAAGIYSGATIIPSNVSVSQAAFFFISDSNATSSANGYAIKYEGGSSTTSVNLYRVDSGSLVRLSSAPAPGGTSDATTFSAVVTASSITVTIAATRSLTLAAIDSAYRTNAYYILYAKDGGGNNTTVYDSLVVPRYKASGTFLSRNFDTAKSTPTWGPFSVSISSNSEATLSFEVQASNDGVSFETLVSQTPGNKITAAQRRYVRYKGTFATSVTTKTATLSDATLSAATTGYFISQCRNPGAAITQWGLFQCNRALNDGDMSFAISVGTTCHGVTRATATWTAQTNNSIITSATNTYVAYRTLFDLDTATEAPTLNDCSISWNEGATRPSVTAEVYRDRYYLAYTSGTTGTVANDRLLVLDSRDQWTTHDQPNCSSLGVYNRKLYCGDSGATGRVFRMDVGQDDDGASFTSNIKTKDFDFGNPFEIKKLNRMYFDLSGLPFQDYAISLTPSYTLDASTDTFTLNPINLNEDYSRFIHAKVPADLSKNVSGRLFSFGLSHTGSQGPWKVFGIRSIFTRLGEVD